MEDKKICGNCRYFLQYYIKSACRFMPIYGGRCSIKKINSNPRIFFNPACDKWESFEIVIQENKNSIYETLIRISKNLDEIAVVLKNEE